MSYARFKRTYLLHGYAGNPQGSVRNVLRAIGAAMGPGMFFGITSNLTMPWALSEGARYDDSEGEKELRLVIGLDQLLETLKRDDADPKDTLIIGTSMGGFAAALAQESFGCSVIAISAPDQVGSHKINVHAERGNLLSIYSSGDDDVIAGRTDLWPQATKFAIDVPGLTHDHDAHLKTTSVIASLYLSGSNPDGIRSTLGETSGSPAPL